MNTIEQLEKLKALVIKQRDLGDVTFNVQVLVSHNRCGTIACLLGLAALSDEFEGIHNTKGGCIVDGDGQDLFVSSAGESIFGLNSVESVALFCCVSDERVTCAERLGLDTNLNHFTAENPTYDDAIEAIDAMISHKRGQVA